MPEPQIVLGFDVSINRVGVAIGNCITRDARPLLQINSRDKHYRFNEIQRLISEWEPQALIVGVPSHADGTALPNTSFCLRFANQLRGRFARPVIEVNENYSTVVVRSEAGMDLEDETDAWSAVCVLEQYLQDPQQSASVSRIGIHR